MPIRRTGAAGPVATDAQQRENLAVFQRVEDFADTHSLVNVITRADPSGATANAIRRRGVLFVGALAIIRG